MSTTPFSIDFFPPQTPAGVDKLRATRAQIAARWREAAGLPAWSPAPSPAPETAA